MSRFVRRVLVLAGLDLLAVAGLSCTGDSGAMPELDAPLGIVLLIGDGMGVGAVDAGRLSAGSLSMESLSVRGTVGTENAFDDITDSGASATAYATGIATYNRAVGVGPDSLPRQNIVEVASGLGMATGIVATSSITHATPAAFLAHVEDRGEEEEIARQIAVSGADLVVGGGYRYFDPAFRTDGHDLISQLRSDGYSVVTPDAEVVWTHDSAAARLFGLFANTHLPPFDSRTPSLSEMTEVALRSLLDREGGFFLLVEGSQIDWAAHDNDSEWLVGEVLDFDDAVATVLDLVQDRPRTLVIVTADHETGGLAVEAGAVPGEIVFTWSGPNHTADPVPLFAYGYEADRFAGELTNAEVGILLHELVQDVRLVAATAGKPVGR